MHQALKFALLWTWNSLFRASLVVQWLGVCLLGRGQRFDPWPGRRHISSVAVQLLSHAHSLRPHEPQHARLFCPSPTPRACSNSCPSSWWCYTTVSFSVIPFSFCLQTFPASGSFTMSQFFITGGQVLDLQLQHQCFWWIFRNDFL